MEEPGTSDSESESSTDIAKDKTNVEEKVIAEFCPRNMESYCMLGDWEKHTKVSFF